MVNTKIQITTRHIELSEYNKIAIKKIFNFLNIYKNKVNKIHVIIEKVQKNKEIKIEILLNYPSKKQIFIKNINKDFYKNLSILENKLKKEIKKLNQIKNKVKKVS